MKRPILVLVLMLLGMNLAWAQGELALIYINGSNTNDAKMKAFFERGVAKFHPVLKKTLEEDDFTQKYLLEDGSCKISPEPVSFFWGDMSYKEIEKLNSELSFLERYSPKVSQFVRSTIASIMHDAIWVSRQKNMTHVLELLHKEVMEQHALGNKVVLFGYSAGSFVTYEYYLTRLPIINVKESFASYAKSDELKRYVAESPIKNTCFEAFLRNEITTYNHGNGLVINENNRDFYKNFDSLPEATAKFCVPEGTIKGVVNYASPLPLFYSDPMDFEDKMTFIRVMMYKYVIENDLFWLTVNWSNDPLGFPTTQNPTIDKVEQETNVHIEPKLGFFYDKSNVSSRGTFATAHTSYWDASKRFSKNILNAYKEGYAYFHKGGVRPNE